MQHFKYSSINLWCTKNLVDTQFLLWKLFTIAENTQDAKSWEATLTSPLSPKQLEPYENLKSLRGKKWISPQYYSDPYDTEVDVVFLNTCGFISSGREEAIEVIKQLTKGNKTIYVLWCAIQYYKNIDKDSKNPLEGKNIHLLSRNDFDTVTLEQLVEWYDSKNFWDFEFSESPRVYTNFDYGFEYIKIAEWCDNNCTFCIIPKIRGKQKSLPKEKILQEITQMVNDGMQEVILIAQDSTRYWTDLYGEPALFDLLQEIENIPGDFKYRLLYLYPDILSLDHIKKLTTFKKWIPYFDIPLQHVSAPLLKKMGRFYDENAIEEFLKFIKNNFPIHYIRTNIIIGFPGETDEDQAKLITFLKKNYFDNIALFEYHDEPFAASSKLPNKVDDDTLRSRFLEIDNLVDQLLTDKENARIENEETWFIVDIKEKKTHNTQNSKSKIFITVRPRLHCPEVDAYDKITADKIISIPNPDWTIDIGDKIEYIV